MSMPIQNKDSGAAGGGVVFPFTITVRLPGDLEVIPSIRKFVSEALQVSGFSAKFAFRTEIIVDAICNNAITYGNELDAESCVEVACEIHADRVDVIVRDRGGSSSNIERLKEAVAGAGSGLPISDYGAAGMGLEIVRLLSETIELNVDENNLTSIHVIRRREDVG
jgi:anti-sigma regulatory factor (Ser/Thr protein kinase)